MGPPATDELAASLKLSVGGELDQPASVDVYGALLGTEADASELLDGLVVRAGADPALAWVKQLSFADAAVLGRPTGGGSRGGAWPPLPIGAVPVSGCQVGVLQAAAPSEAVAALVKNFVQGRAASESRELDFFRGVAPTTAFPPLPRPLSTAMSSFSSSMQS